jgi:hypothetical protein
MVRTAVLAGLLAATGACASMQTVALAPFTEGVSTTYARSYGEVSAAAVDAVKKLKLVVEGSDETDTRFQVRFSKPVSAFSWGEVGVINVIRAGEATTRVYINTEKRDQMQLTGTSEMKFAQDIFAGIRTSLEALPPVAH